MKTYRAFLLRLTTLLWLAAAPASYGQAPPPLPDAAELETWGRESFTRTKQQLGRTGEQLYYESRNLQNNSTSGVNGYSFIWPLSTQLRAVNQLVELDAATHTSELLGLANQMHAGYWRTQVAGRYPIDGYAADFNFNTGDRFYDDDAHLVVGLVEAYRLTGNTVLLDRAKATHAFVMSGEWKDANGNTRGIRFVEKPDDRTSNTISVLQGARGAAMLFQETADQVHLANAVKLLAWANANLRTPDNAYYQDYNIDTNQPGGVAIVNGLAIGISAHIELFRATGQQSYLDGAVALAQAAVGRYINRQTHVISDEGFWAFELVEAFNDLTLETGDMQWVLRSMSGLDWLHTYKRDSNGNYGKFWGREGPVTGTYTVVELNNMAPVTLAYLHTANTLRTLDLPLPGDLVAELLFNETAGTTASDNSGQRNHATLTGGPAWVAGIHGNALDFDGTNDLGRLPNGFLYAVDDCTISTWVRLDTVDNWSRIFDFSSDSSNFMFVTPRNGATGKLRFEIRAKGGTTQVIDGPAALPAGKWVHVAVTLAGDTGRLFLDGVEVGSKTGIPWRPRDLGITQNNFLGKSQFPDPLLNGQLDDFRIHRRALAANEIATLAAQVPEPPANLAAASGFGKIDLSWGAVPKAESYKVKRATTTGGPYAAIASGVSTTHFTDTTVVPGTPYFYVVTASNTAGESTPSVEASATAKEPFVALNGQQPRVPAWSIAQLLSWNSTSDPAAPFNVSAVPLAPRISVAGALKANPNARTGQGRIQSLDTYNASTSGNSPQGGRGGNYEFNYWQYLSEAVYWGGSAGEGIVVPPSAEITDAAHRNGVPMIGTVFFPPTAFGGQYAWVQQFLQRNGDRFPAADKLIEAAEYFGFDGWFINQETAGGSSQDAAAFRDLIKYMRDRSDLHIVWYDSMIEAGPIVWQDQLNSLNDWYLRHNYVTQNQDLTGDRIAHNIFLDFVVNSETAQSSRAYASGLLGLDPYKSVYAGFEMQEGNFKDARGARQNISTVFPDGQDHIISAGLYIPRQHAGSLSDQDLFWGGANRDPRNTSNTVGTGNWHGIAHHIAAQSAATSLPFATNFGIGSGNEFRLQGKPTGTPRWWNRSLQDVLPTWRWIIDSSGSKLSPQLTSDDAFFGGGSLRFSGNLNADNTVRLFLAELPVEADTKLRTVFKRGIAGVDSQMQVGIALASAPTVFHYLPAGACKTSGWNTVEIPLGGFAGETIAAIGLKFVAAPTVASYELLLGQVAIYNESAPLPEPPTAVAALERATGSSAATRDLNLRWTHSPSDRQFYLVFQRQTDGTLQYLGSTPNNRYFADEAPIGGDIVVVTVGRDFRVSAPSDGKYFQNLIAHKGTYTGASVARLGVDLHSGYTTLVATGGTGSELFEIDSATASVTVKDAAALDAAAPGTYTLTAEATGGGVTAIAVSLTIELLESNTFASSQLARQFWTGFTGNLDQLQNLKTYPHAPGLVRHLDLINEGDLGMDAFGSRVRAYVVPAVSGNYRFYIASDDDSRLRMSPSEDPAGAGQIAYVLGAVNPGAFTQQGFQISEPRALVAGQRYYLEILHREGFGGDHLSLGWSGPGISSPTVVPASALEPFNINDVPVWGAGPRSFEIPAGTTGGSVIGRISALDPEGEAVHFSLLGGDAANRFRINVRSGEISLAPGATLAANETVALLVGLQDQGLGGRYPLGQRTGEITIYTGSPLVADLKFDELSGTIAADSSGNGNAASLVNGPVWTEGYSDNGLEFDGSNDHALLPGNALSGLEDFAISTWVRLDSNAAWTRIFDLGENSSRYLFITPRNGENQAVRFAIRSSAGVFDKIDGTGPLPTGVWTHVAVTLSGSTGVLYVNGLEVGRNSAMRLSPSDLGEMTRNYIGRSQFNDPYLDGILDRFQIFRRALTAGEIAALASPPSAPANFTATPGDGQIGLTWDPVTGATGYTVLRGTSSGGPFSAIGNSISPGFVDLTVTSGITYFYAVTSSRGVAESARSREIITAAGTPAEIWRQLQFGTTENTGDAADAADPDGDLVSNLLERAFGGNPNAAEHNLLPRIDPAAPRLSIIYRKSQAASDLTFAVEESSDLSSDWIAAEGNGETVSDNGTVKIMRFTRPSLSAGPLFLRLKVMTP